MRCRGTACRAQTIRNHDIYLKIRYNSRTMKPSIQFRLERLAERHQELAALLGDANIIADQKKFTQYSREFAQLEPVTAAFTAYQQSLQALAEMETLAQDTDADMRQMAADETQRLNVLLTEQEQALYLLLIPQDPNDASDVYLEIRAGTGGDEAAIFAGDLFRMYHRYAETVGWHVEVISESQGEHGGFKEIIAKVSGDRVYSQLKFESGAHRVQRVPLTEAQGRVHTSACTVAILPEVDEIHDIDINPADLKTDTYRASGAGGQHVNKTDSAVRITHIPTGIVVECQEERSQHKNRAKALSWLKARILSAQQQKQQQEQAATRKSLVGSGDRSERIRTYNFPQGRLTDHRINLTLYKLGDIMEGDLAQVLEPLVREYQTEQLAALGE